MEPIDCSAIPTRDKPHGDFAWQDNELYEVFQPLIGPHPVSVYATLTRRAFSGKRIRYSVRDLAAKSGQSPSTVSRSLEVLECTGLVRLHRNGGNSASECELVDLKELCRHLGGAREKRAASYILPESTVKQLRARIQLLRIEQSGKGSTKRESERQSKARNGGGNLFPAVSQRNTSVPQVKRQRFARETQAPPHLLLQNTKHANCPTPNPPAHDSEEQTDKTHPDEDEPDRLLLNVRASFTGVMKDMGKHLLDTSRLPNPRFTNGAQDWENYTFGSLAVKAVEWRGAVLMLTLSASDPAAARVGLTKYRRTWEPSLCRWYGCEVSWNLQQ